MQNTYINTLAPAQRESLASLIALGIDAYSKERLTDVQSAIDHPHSNYSSLTDDARSEIKRLIGSIIGEQKPAKPVQQRVARVSKPLNFSHIDDAKCHPNLREILINRFPRRPYCTNDLSAGLSPRRLDEALKFSHIQHNPPGWKSAIVLDIDRKISDLEWADASLPAPTWVSKNKKNGHAHFVWMLSNPVWAGGVNQRPAKFFAAVLDAFRARLSGDEGYANLITKNPISTVWQTTSPSNFSKYDLAYLAEFVDLESPTKQRKKEPSAIAGVGRNCTLFDELRLWSYQRASDPNLSDLVTNYAHKLNSNFNQPMDESEVKAIAKSITKFCQKMDGRGKADFVKRQSRRGQLSGEARSAQRNQNALQAHLMRLEGISNSGVAIKLSQTKRNVINLVNFWKGCSNEIKIGIHLTRICTAISNIEGGGEMNQIR